MRVSLRQWRPMDNQNDQCQTHHQATLNTRAGQRHRDPLVYTHPYDCPPGFTKVFPF